MAPLKINTWGVSAVTRPAERAILHIAVSAEGPSQEAVSQDVARTATALRTKLQSMYNGSKTTGDIGGGTAADASGGLNPAPIEKWSSNSISTGSYIPVVSSSGSRLKSSTASTTAAAAARVFTARQVFTATFVDFGALSVVATDLSLARAISISHVEWKLTDATQKALGAETRTNAAREALQKALDFGAALRPQQKTIRAMEVVEQQGGYGGGGGAHLMRAFNGSGMGSEKRAELVFEPEEVEVRCGVDCKFELDIN